mmetsp:Transcript_82086/g.237993  ORF Transcript_82086/g.237993 Transcript_82086/m.237993 type:complete len:461 (-) Transcript_82086:270-1652(-)
MGQTTSTMSERYYMQKVRLGHGSFGTVWRAVDRRSGAAVAMKHMEKAKLRRMGIRREDVEREVAMMKACAHENIAQLFGMFEDEAHVYLAQEYCDSGDFSDKLRERGLAIREAEAAGWIRQMCSAVGALHLLGICHRDVKPENFLVRGGEASGGASPSGTLKLSDFGLAVFLPPGGLLTQKCGTPAFMAPEQHMIPRSRGYGFPADVWAAGVSMYQVMFGGLHPFMDDKGRLKEEQLLKGELDFRPLGANHQPLRADHQRFTEQAVAMCRSLVERNPAKRLTAADAAKSSWATCPPGGGASGGAATLRTASSPSPGAGSRVSARHFSWNSGAGSQVGNVHWPRPPGSRAVSPTSEPWRQRSVSPDAPACRRVVSLPFDTIGGAGMTSAKSGERALAMKRAATLGNKLPDESDTMTAFVVGAREVIDTTAEVQRSVSKFLFGGCGRGSPRRRALQTRYADV